MHSQFSHHHAPKAQDHRFSLFGHLHRGDNVYAAVREAVHRLQPGETLTFHAPFVPTALIKLLQREHLAPRPEKLSDGSWEIVCERHAAR